MSKLPCLVNLPNQEGAIVVKAGTLARLGATNQHLAKSHSLTNKTPDSPLVFQHLGCTRITNVVLVSL